MPQHIHIEEAGEVAVVRIDRPPANALDLDLLAEGHEVRCRLADEKPKAVVLTGRDRFFSAGMDLKAAPALTPDQQRYWPAVAGALRAITRQRAPEGGPRIAARDARGTFVDPNSAEVARLKSAAIPLIMTMREEQKREVRMLAHLMGLESVAAQF